MSKPLFVTLYISPELIEESTRKDVEAILGEQAYKIAKDFLAKEQNATA